MNREQNFWRLLLARQALPEVVQGSDLNFPEEKILALCPENLVGFENQTGQSVPEPAQPDYPALLIQGTSGSAVLLFRYINNP
ncbi:MAG: hypothetical protein ACLFPQ_01145 [Candidatus Woesearchaeota archaeon]